MNWTIYFWTALVLAIVSGCSDASAKDAYNRVGDSPWSNKDGSFFGGMIFGLIVALPVAYFLSQFK